LEQIQSGTEQRTVDEKVYKVLVGIPLKGHTPPASYHDRMLMFKHLGGQEAVDFYEKKSPRYVFSFGAIGEILVPYARETLAKNAMAMGADYLFMIDDDMLAPPDLFYKLVKHDVDIVAALAFTRNPNHLPVIYSLIEGYDPVTKNPYCRSTVVMNYPKNQLFECDAVGFGAVLIKVDTIRKMQEPYFFGMAATGEDVQFCLKARKQANARVFMDSSIKLGHLSSPIIVTEDYANAFRGMTDEQRDKIYGQYQKYSTTENIK